MSVTLTPVEIPEDVRDNSETVTDYAFMRHLSPVKGMNTVAARESALTTVAILGYQVYDWLDVNPNGQRCRFTMITNRAGSVVNLFHTEYFTRVACHTGDWCYSYATHYALVYKDDEPTTDDPLPYCDEHLRTIREAADRQPGMTLTLSERLLIGQHD